jgi:hypothetical protein
VRGVANAELTPELALVLGRAAARVLGSRHVVIGETLDGPGRCSRRRWRRVLLGRGDVELAGVLAHAGVAFLSDVRGACGP